MDLVVNLTHSISTQIHRAARGSQTLHSDVCLQAIHTA